MLRNLADSLVASDGGWKSTLDFVCIDEIGVITPDQWDALTQLTCDEEVTAIDGPIHGEVELTAIDDLELDNPQLGRRTETWLK